MGQVSRKMSVQLCWSCFLVVTARYVTRGHGNYFCLVRVKKLVPGFHFCVFLSAQYPQIYTRHWNLRRRRSDETSCVPNLRKMCGRFASPQPTEKPQNQSLTKHNICCSCRQKIHGMVVNLWFNNMRGVILYACYLLCFAFFVRFVKNSLLTAC